MGSDNGIQWRFKRQSQKKKKNKTPHHYGGKPDAELLTTLKDQTTPEHYARWMDSQKTQTEENKESPSKSLWNICANAVPAPQNQKLHSPTTHETKFTLCERYTARTPKFFQLQVGKKMKILVYFGHLWDTMEHADSQYFCWTKATAHCLLSGYAWIDTVETTINPLTPRFHLNFSLIFSFFLLTRKKKNTGQQWDTNSQCWLSILDARC